MTRIQEETRRTNKLLEKLPETWEWQQIWKEQTEKQAEEQTHPQSKGTGQSQETRRICRVWVSGDAPQWEWWIIVPVSVAAVCAAAALLFWIPTIQGLSSGVESWFQTVRDMVIPLMKPGTNANAKEQYQHGAGGDLLPDDCHPVHHYFGRGSLSNGHASQADLDRNAL